MEFLTVTTRRSTEHAVSSTRVMIGGGGGAGAEIAISLPYNMDKNFNMVKIHVTPAFLKVIFRLCQVLLIAPGNWGLLCN